MNRYLLLYAANNIRESYCSFEVSKLLKEKEFRVPCNYYYLEKDYADLLNKNREFFNLPERFKEGDVGEQKDKKHKGRLVDRNKYDTTTSRPTHGLAIEWIRLAFNMWITIGYLGDGYNCTVQNKEGYTKKAMGNFNTPQEATEAILLYTLQKLIP